MTAYYNAPRYALDVVEPVTVEPVTLEEAMEHLNIDLDARHNDGWLRRNIPTARQMCESDLGRSLAPQTLEIVFGGQSPVTTVPSYWQTPALNPWAADSHYIELPYGPVLEVESVIYADAAGDEQTMLPADYVLAGDQLWLASGSTWPTVATTRNAIAIRYVAGYTLPEDALPYPLPAVVHSAMLVMLGHLDGNRAAVEAGTLHEIPMGVRYMLQPYRLRLGMA